MRESDLLNLLSNAVVSLPREWKNWLEVRQIGIRNNHSAMR